MLDEFLNKDCQIIVSLSDDYSQAGSVPSIFYGTIISYDEKFIKVKTTRIRENLFGKLGVAQNMATIDGVTLLNRNYVIAIMMKN
jgi:hypothetical protein